MTAIADSVAALSAQNAFLPYFIFYIATIFVGNVSAFVALWLLFKGYFTSWNILILFGVIMASYLTGDVLWYSLGKKLRDTRLGNWLLKRIKQHDKIESHLHRNSDRWIFVSKFLYASSFPILFLIGWMKIPFKKMLRISLLTIFISLPVLVGLTYGLFAGLTLLEAVAVFKRVERLLVIGVIAFLLLNYLVVPKIIRKIFKTNNGQ